MSGAGLYKKSVWVHPKNNNEARRSRKCYISVAGATVARDFARDVQRGYVQDFGLAWAEVGIAKLRKRSSSELHLLLTMWATAH